MNEQIISCLRALADGLEAGTTRVSRFAQDGNLTSRGEIYEGSLELYFTFNVEGITDEDFYIEDDDPDGLNEAVSNTLNKLLEKKEILNGEY